MIEQTVPSFGYRIWIAGDIADARRVCREFCTNVGLCVTVTPTDFVYSGGMESGVVVGLLHYPRFPTTEDDLATKAGALAMALQIGLSQWSVMIEGPRQTVWLSRRPETDK